MSFLSGVKESNGSIWPCEGPGFTRISGKWVHELIKLANVFCVVFALYQPPKSQYSSIILSLGFTCHFEV